MLLEVSNDVQFGALEFPALLVFAKKPMIGSVDNLFVELVDILVHVLRLDVSAVQPLIGADASDALQTCGHS